MSNYAPIPDKEDAARYGHWTACQNHKVRMAKAAAEMVSEKYEAGITEHGGGLWKEDLMMLTRSALDETVDQFTYLRTQLDRLDELRRYLADQMDATTNQRDWDKWAAAYTILTGEKRTPPLAWFQKNYFPLETKHFKTGGFVGVDPAAAKGDRMGTVIATFSVHDGNRCFVTPRVLPSLEFRKYVLVISPQYPKGAKCQITQVSIHVVDPDKTIYRADIIGTPGHGWWFFKNGLHIDSEDVYVDRELTAEEIAAARNPFVDLTTAEDRDGGE